MLRIHSLPSQASDSVGCPRRLQLPSLIDLWHDCYGARPLIILKSRLLGLSTSRSLSTTLGYSSTSLDTQSPLVLLLALGRSSSYGVSATWHKSKGKHESWFKVSRIISRGRRSSNWPLRPFIFLKKLQILKGGRLYQSIRPSSQCYKTKASLCARPMTDNLEDLPNIYLYKIKDGMGYNQLDFSPSMEPASLFVSFSAHLSPSDLLNSVLIPSLSIGGNEKLFPCLITLLSIKKGKRRRVKAKKVSMSCRRTRKAISVQVHFDSQAMRESEDFQFTGLSFRYSKPRYVGWEPKKTSQALSLVWPFTRVNTKTDNSRCNYSSSTFSIGRSYKSGFTLFAHTKKIFREALTRRGRVGMISGISIYPSVRGRRKSRPTPFHPDRVSIKFDL
ncbi:hypothetical protein M9H77_02885 [Catharanthus roseus]|uniref:Uncharacterized protein n=1 Tax=Catharanthus roseus TaxID=4058 RepID=A0ACC0C9Y6_CATRO|nr:hypothetical protein M9H77_02885 [Catharanthus roseus]